MVPTPGLLTVRIQLIGVLFEQVHECRKILHLSDFLALSPLFAQYQEEGGRIVAAKYASFISNTSTKVLSFNFQFVPI
jgi:hypothetical protein